MFCVLFCFTMKDQPNVESQMLLGIPLLVWKLNWRWLGSCEYDLKKKKCPVTDQSFLQVDVLPAPQLS